MKISINFFIFFSVLIVFSLSTSCCKDPCKNKVRTSAAFTMKYGIGDTSLVLENRDTVRKGSTITFEANDISSNAISYSWKIGTDLRVFTKSKFELEFDVIGKIDIELVVKKSPDLDCFPDDDGIDTIRQSFVLADTILSLGKYDGYVESKPNEKFTVTVILDYMVGKEYIDNLPNGCARDQGIDWRLAYLSNGYRAFQIATVQRSENLCSGIFGFGKLAKDNKSLTINYIAWNESQKKFVNEKFIGTKK